MLVLSKLGADFRGGVRVRGSATYFSRPSPALRFANRSGQRRAVGGCELYAVCTYDQTLLEGRVRSASLQRQHVPSSHLPHDP
jgi:hypothetical protein